jgi:hypothetical protein
VMFLPDGTMNPLTFAVLHHSKSKVNIRRAPAWMIQVWTTGKDNRGSNEPGQVLPARTNVKHDFRPTVTLDLVGSARSLRVYGG